MNNSEYQAADGISKSMLDAINVSPLNFWDRYINPDREPQEEKHCFKVGSGTHTLALEPELFDQQYFVGFDKSKHPEALDTGDQMKAELKKFGLMVGGTKAEMADRLINEAGIPASRIMMMLEQAHMAQADGKELISANDYNSMTAMIKRIRNHRYAGGLIQDATVEQSFFWTDPDGVKRKCRPDIITRNGQWVVDLKTTTDCGDKEFGSTITKRRYDVQAAWYLDVLAGLYGTSAPAGFAFIAVEKARPFDCSVHYLTAEQIARGRALYQKDLALMVECQRSNTWPGKDRGRLIEAVTPIWAKNDIE